LQVGILFCVAYFEKLTMFIPRLLLGM